MPPQILAALVDISPGGEITLNVLEPALTMVGYILAVIGAMFAFWCFRPLVRLIKGAITKGDVPYDDGPSDDELWAAWERDNPKAAEEAYHAAWHEQYRKDNIRARIRMSKSKGPLPLP